MSIKTENNIIITNIDLTLAYLHLTLAYLHLTLAYSKGQSRADIYSTYFANCDK